MTNAKLIMQISENHTQEFEIPEFFDFIAVEDSFGKHIIQVQKNYLQTEGWIDKKTIKNIISEMKSISHFKIDEDFEKEKMDGYYQAIEEIIKGLKLE